MPMRPLGPFISRLRAEPDRTVFLAVALVLVAAVWIEAGHFVFGTVPSSNALLETLNDLLPLGVLATVGAIAGTRWSKERERTLAALQASEQRARELVDESADGILVSSPDGRYVEANPAMCRMLGYSRAELLAFWAGGLTADDDPVGNAGMDQRLAQAAGVAGILVERRYRKRDGTSLPVEVRFSVLPDGRQQRNVRDISERVRAQADEAREARIRSALTEAVHDIAVDATVEEAGQVICDVLSTLPGVDFTGVEAFSGEHEVVMLAGTIPSAFPTHPGDALPLARARYLRERAAQGPWAEYWVASEAFGPWWQAVGRAGLRAAAFGPIVHNDHVDGVLVIGTADEEFARTLVEHTPGVVAFTATSSAVLAERLHARRHEVELCETLGSVLASGAFHPVFQPIVDLGSSEVVGYEALTRFDSGRRPDLCFADAWSVGLGPDFEIAAIEAAIAAAKELPSGRWLDLNASPRLLADPERLKAVLWSADRPIVLEITEHEVIEDYKAVREPIRALGNDVRLAVDDAGAGVANFGHIIDLRPDFVKLDISLVRRVNANLGRQAMVVGMHHFSRTAGCRLVAEGIETDEEARTLTGLGVEFGQGYLFGHPAPAAVWATADGASERP
jgi:PAS domain S-box-containing protein